MKNHTEPAALQSLPMPLQQKILEFLDGDEKTPSRSATECAHWLAGRGIVTDPAAIEQWKRQQLHRLRIEWCKSMTTIAIEDARLPNHVYSDDEVLSIGIRLFNALVVKTCRHEKLAQNQTTAIRRQAILRLERELGAELEKFAAANSHSSHPSPP